MNDIVLEGLFLIGAAVVGGLLAIIGSMIGAGVQRIRGRNQQLKAQVERLLRQVEAYHLLEDLYAQELSNKDPAKSAKTIKTDYRNTVVRVHQCSRPAMTANEAKKQLVNF